MSEVWSYNEWNGGKEDYLGKFGLTDEMLIKRFGEVDIKLMVPDKTSYLNNQKGDTVEGAKQLDQERYGFEQFINELRKENKVDGTTPTALLSEEQLQTYTEFQKLKNKAAKEQLMIENPVLALSQQWKEGVDQDDRNLLTFLTGGGTESGKGIIGTGIDIYQGEAGFDALKKLGIDSIQGVKVSAIKMAPDLTKENFALVGELFGNLPYYFYNKKGLANAFLNPSKYPGQVGAVAGSASAGAYGASVAYDGLNAAIRELKDLPDPALSTDPSVENLNNAKNALVFTGGAASLEPAFKKIKNWARWWYGVKEGSPSEELAKKALGMNAPFGIQNVTSQAWAKWYGRVVGVFPFIGQPLRASKAKTAYWADEQLMANLNELAPLTSVMHAGGFLTEEAKKKFAKWAYLNDQFYNDFYVKAAALDDAVGVGNGYIPTARLKETAKSYADLTRRGEVVTDRGKVIGGLQQAPDFEQFLMSFEGLPEYINAFQFRNLQKTFNQKWGEYASKYGVKENDTAASHAFPFKKALEEGLTDTRHWKLPTSQGGQPDPALVKQMELVIQSLDIANENFAPMATLYKSPVAQTFSQVDRAMFVQGAVENQGWIYDDQLAQQLFDTFFTRPSARALEDLSKIVTRNADPNKDPLNRAARVYMNQLFEKSADSIPYNIKTGSIENLAFQQKEFLSKSGVSQEAFKTNIVTSNPDIRMINIFNPQKFRNSLKLETQDGKNFMLELYSKMINPATGEAYGQAGAKAALENLNTVLDIAQIGYDTKIAETAQFVARRAVLGGRGAILGAFIATNFAGGPLAGLGMAFLARHQAKILSDPKKLSNLVNLMDDTLNDKVRRANYVRLFRALYPGESDVPEGLDIEDTEEVLNFMLMRDFQPSVTNEDISPAPGAPQELPTFEPNFMREDAPERGPAEIELMEFKKQNKLSNNMSNELLTKPKNKFVASNVSNPFRPVGGNMSPAKRAALASGDLYQAIATAKKGGSINKQGIMYFAGRRRP
jgi:hypothetical protein